MRVEIDRDGCIGCTLCAATCPEVFEMADDGKAKVKDEPTVADPDEVQRAADGCPVDVIEVDM